MEEEAALVMDENISRNEEISDDTEPNYGSREKAPLSYIIHSILSFLLFFGILFNISTYFTYLPSNQSYPFHVHHVYDAPQDLYPDPGGIPLFDEIIEFNKTELDAAIVKLNLPTWSRGYVHCSDPRSEVKCGQVIKAYRRILEWESAVSKHAKKDDSFPGLIHTYTKNGGIGNRIMQETVASVAAMMMGRAVSVSCSVPAGNKRVSHHPYNYPAARTIRYMNMDLNNCGKKTKHLNVDIEGNFQNFDFSSPSLSDTHLVFKTCSLSSLIYLNQQLSSFAREYFGMFAQYFIMNYISEVPDRFIKSARELTANVPQNVRLFGVHLRFQWAGQFYSWSIESTMAVVKPFIDYMAGQQPTQFALASDNQEMMNSFGRHFKYIDSRALRVADGDHDSGFRDIVLLMMCDECLLTYRSTFSNLVCMRTGRRPWLIEKQAKTIFLAFNSQGGVQHPIFHTKYWKIYLTNEYVSHCGNEESLRYYYRYLSLG